MVVYLLCPAIPRPELCIMVITRVRAGARVVAVVESPDWGMTTFMFLRRRSTRKLIREKFSAPPYQTKYAS